MALQQQGAVGREDVPGPHAEGAFVLRTRSAVLHQPKEAAQLLGEKRVPELRISLLRAHVQERATLAAAIDGKEQLFHESNDEHEYRFFFYYFAHYFGEEADNMKTEQ